MTQILDRIGTAADVADMFKQFEHDSVFLVENWDAWLKEYPDSWVVVYGGELVGHGNTLQKVLRIAEERDAPINRCAIAFLSSKPQHFLLVHRRVCR